jgi:hypothetical protein
VGGVVGGAGVVGVGVWVGGTDVLVTVGGRVAVAEGRSVGVTVGVSVAVGVSVSVGESVAVAV